MIKETLFSLDEAGERLRIKCPNSEHIFVLDEDGYLTEIN